MSSTKSHYVSDIWKQGIFDRKVVFCTGGAGTICSAQVRALVHLGANACIVGRNVEKTESMARDISSVRKGAKVLGIGAVDVRNVESLEQAVRRCREELGGIDFLIAGAAGNFLAPITQLSSNAFKAVMDIDVLGSYNTLKATLPSLVESASKHKSDGKTGKQALNESPQLSPLTLTNTPASPSGTGGRIIFISATLHYTGIPLQTHVSVAKAGIDSLSNATAIEFGPRGITSNVIAPGPIENSEGIERLTRSEQRAASRKAVPLGRWGYVKDIADATVFLFSDAANFVTGQTLVVDGAAWRTASSNPGAFNYPDFLLSDEVVTQVKRGKKSKL